MSKSRIVFTVELSRPLTHEEQEALEYALTAQCEELMVDDEERDVGYTQGSEFFAYKEE